MQLFVEKHPSIIMEHSTSDYFWPIYYYYCLSIYMIRTDIFRLSRSRRTLHQMHILWQEASHIAHIQRTENFYHFIRNLIFNSILAVFKLHIVVKSENAIRRTLNQTCTKSEIKICRPPLPFSSTDSLCSQCKLNNSIQSALKIRLFEFEKFFLRCTQIWLRSVSLTLLSVQFANAKWDYFILGIIRGDR